MYSMIVLDLPVQRIQPSKILLVDPPQKAELTSSTYICIYMSHISFMTDKMCQWLEALSLSSYYQKLRFVSNINELELLTIDGN